MTDAPPMTNNQGMKKPQIRNRLTVGGTAIVAAVVVALLFLWPTGPRPCRATFELVREGMTLEQVAATAGGPPGRYSDGYEHIVETGGRYPRAVQWVAHDANLIVWYDGDGVANSVLVAEPMPDNRSWLQWLRGRLGF